MNRILPCSIPSPVRFTRFFRFSRNPGFPRFLDYLDLVPVCTGLIQRQTPPPHRSDTYVRGRWSREGCPARTLSGDLQTRRPAGRMAARQSRISLAGQMQPKIPAINLKLQYEAIREETDSAIRRVLERQDFILGPEVSALEQAVARRHDCAYGIGCASGSDALLLSLLALGIGPGDAVLVPAFSFFSTAGSVARTGARPVFVHIYPPTFNLAPSAVEAALRGGQIQGMPKAMIPVHLYGQCAAMDSLLELAARHHLS